MKPEEAKTKVCPMMVNYYGAMFRDCKAEGCMAWLWTDTEWDNEEGKTINVGGRCGFIRPDTIRVREA